MRAAEEAEAMGWKPMLLGANPSPAAKSGAFGIAEHVFDRAREAAVADEVVEGLGLPELAGADEQAVDHRRGEALPRVEDRGQLEPGPRLDDRVNVVGHHAPGPKVVSPALEVLEGACDEISGSRVVHDAVAVPGVEEGLDAFVVEFGLAAELVLGELAVAGPLLEPLTLAAPADERLLRDGIGEAEGHGVVGAVLRPVREVGAVANLDIPRACHHAM